MHKPTNDTSGVTQTVKALNNAGWKPLWVQYTGEDEMELVNTVAEAIEEIMAVDDCFLIVEKDGDRGWVRFVMGNDPDEVVCDYTTKLDDALDPMFAVWNA